MSKINRLCALAFGMVCGYPATSWADHVLVGTDPTYFTTWEFRRAANGTCSKKPVPNSLFVDGTDSDDVLVVVDTTTVNNWCGQFTILPVQPIPQPLLGLYIRGGGGNDVIWGGNATTASGRRAYELDGGAGNDTIFSGPTKHINGGEGADFILMRTADDGVGFLIAGNGPDVICSDVPGWFVSSWAPTSPGSGESTYAYGGYQPAPGQPLISDGFTDYFVGASRPGFVHDLVWWLYTADLLNACSNAMNAAFLHTSSALS